MYCSILQSKLSYTESIENFRLNYTVDPRFSEHGFQWIPLYIKQNLPLLSFFIIKTLIQNLGLMSTAFNKFLIILDKNVGFLLKFSHWFSQHYHISKLRSLFAIFCITKIYRISDACSSLKFEVKTFSFEILILSNCEKWRV